eukprot:282617-Hanusia_phi.AAC.1
MQSVEGGDKTWRLRRGRVYADEGRDELTAEKGGLEVEGTRGERRRLEMFGGSDPISTISSL